MQKLLCAAWPKCCAPHGSTIAIPACHIRMHGRFAHGMISRTLYQACSSQALQWQSHTIIWRYIFDIPQAA